jgi:hypothetical protein
MARQYHQGRFTPINPQKYAGDASNIIYRSSWEKKVMIRLDTSPSVVAWSSEEHVIPYLSPIDGKIHRYFVDFVVKYKDQRTGDMKKMMIEVKPFKQTQPPVKGKRTTKRFLEESHTYIINQAKWNSATNFASKHGYEFKIMTEKDLF